MVHVSPMQLQIGEQGIPARRHSQRAVQPALHPQETMCTSLSGAEGKSVGIG